MTAKLITARKGWIAVAITVVSLCTGCRLSNMAPLEVVEWSPEQQRVSNPEKVDAVRLRFSSTPDRPRIESAFSLAANDIPVTGRFRWNGKTMRFTPDSAIDSGNVYRMTVTGDAQDVYGNALVRDFEHVFTTLASETRPTVMRTVPEQADGKVHVPIEEAVIHLEFNRSVDRTSFYHALSISPSFAFSVSWEDADRTATIHTMEALTPQQEYTVQLSTRLKAAHGRTMAEPFEMTVHAGLNGPGPQLLALRASHERAPSKWLDDHAGELFPLPAYPAERREPTVTPTPGWERFWGIEMEFDMPVHRKDVLAALEFDPEHSFSLVPEFASTSTSFEIVPDERFEFARDYTLRMEGAIRSGAGVERRIEQFARFRVDGKASRPPSVARAFFLEDPETGQIIGPITDDDELDLSRYAGDTYTGFFDLYVVPGEGARFGGFDVADGVTFSVENIAADLALVNVVAGEVGTQNAFTPAPASAPAEDEQIIRIYAEIEDLEHSGLITLAIDNSVADTYGNEFEQDWRLRLNKVSAR